MAGWKTSINFRQNVPSARFRNVGAIFFLHIQRKISLLNENMREKLCLLALKSSENLFPQNVVVGSSKTTSVFWEIESILIFWQTISWKRSQFIEWCGLLERDMVTVSAMDLEIYFRIWSLSRNPNDYSEVRKVCLTTQSAELFDKLLLKILAEAIWNCCMNSKASLKFFFFMNEIFVLCEEIYISLFLCNSFKIIYLSKKKSFGGKKCENDSSQIEEKYSSWNELGKWGNKNSV